MELGLQGTVAFVAGASQGLGKAIALGLAQEGCKIALALAGADELARVAEEIKSKTGTDAIVVPADAYKTGRDKGSYRLDCRAVGKAGYPGYERRRATGGRICRAQ